MKNNTTIALLLAALVIGTVGAGVVSAGTNDAQTGNSWYDWMADHMRFGRGYGYGMMGDVPGFCGGYGSYAPVAPGYETNAQEVTVQTVEDALEIAQEQIDSDVSENNIYQMGRWWIVYFTDDDGTIEQAYIDAFTGEVVEDINTATQQAYGPTNTLSYRGGMGYGMMYGY